MLVSPVFENVDLKNDALGQFQNSVLGTAVSEEQFSKVLEKLTASGLWANSDLGMLFRDVQF
jgi:hypothetical protein